MRGGSPRLFHVLADNSMPGIIFPRNTQSFSESSINLLLCERIFGATLITLQICSLLSETLVERAVHVSWTRQRLSTNPKYGGKRQKTSAWLYNFSS